MFPENCAEISSCHCSEHSGKVFPRKGREIGCMVLAQMPGARGRGTGLGQPGNTSCSVSADYVLPGSRNSPGEMGAAAMPTMPLAPGTARTALPAVPKLQQPQSIPRGRPPAAPAFLGAKILCLLLEGSKPVVF